MSQNQPAPELPPRPTYVGAGMALRLIVVSLFAAAFLVGALPTRTGAASAAASQAATLQIAVITPHVPPAPHHPCKSGLLPSPAGSCAASGVGVGLAAIGSDYLSPRLTRAPLGLLSRTASAQWRGLPPDRPPRV